MTLCEDHTMDAGDGLSKALNPGLWDGFLKGSRISCARLITAVENSPKHLSSILNRLYPLQKGAIRVGVTGPPGVGKSTITAALTRKAREAGHKVGIIAVDPTSPFSGGAFLGDRIRMKDLVGDDGVFIRSLASREGHGGLSPATPYVADVFDAFGMDWIFIETVGVGQAELDVLTCSDVVIVVLQPSTGDMIQALKAGILEAGDLFVINKADLSGADIMRDSLRFIFEMETAEGQHISPPILTATARDDSGIEEVFAELGGVIEKLGQAGRFLDKRRERIEGEIEKTIRQSLWASFLKVTGSKAEIEAEARDCVEHGKSPFPLIRELCSRIRLEPLQE